MIKRYQRDILESIWSDENKFKTYLKVELESLKAWQTLGIIPKSDVDLICQKATFKLEDINALERETKHDLIAFTRAVSISLGPEKKWFHYGLTSTDVVDTAYGVIYKEVNEILEHDLNEFIEILKQQALKYQMTPIVGRTHGMHADVTSFGLKFALWYDEMLRHKERFQMARNHIEMGKISGAVGNFANVPPAIQDMVCRALGIGSAKISTQTLQRDRHAFYLQTIALIGTTLEKIGIEVRHLSRSEVGEVEEAFAPGQKGSSAMPHKRNPIASENIAGIARVLRGYATTSYDNMLLWHERDISHSSAERIIMPDATTLLDYALTRYVKVLKDLVVHEDKMKENIHLNYQVIFSQRVLNALIEKGLSREEAYDLIQLLSFKAIQEKQAFQILLKQDKVIQKHLSNKEVDACFTLEYYLKEVNTIYQRLGLI